MPEYDPTKLARAIFELVQWALVIAGIIAAARVLEHSGLYALAGVLMLLLWSHLSFSIGYFFGYTLTLDETKMTPRRRIVHGVVSTVGRLMAVMLSYAAIAWFTRIILTLAERAAD
ncbi:hypothetical protein SAMN04488012_12014 [Palleronia salina]|uniref:Uncharacterized protein n=1 Tax=Palleronia salina TaxID=313368 RepID=A0A1M6M5B0_9RHOB|nr:hypothetical protein [Palleronia salina]SHJ78483.1 hypothetical protein SAMN04488012_12014 [Palleronia salina]